MVMFWMSVAEEVGVKEAICCHIDASVVAFAEAAIARDIQETAVLREFIVQNT